MIFQHVFDRCWLSKELLAHRCVKSSSRCRLLFGFHLNSIPHQKKNGENQNGARLKVQIVTGAGALFVRTMGPPRVPKSIQWTVQGLNSWQIRK